MGVQKNRTLLNLGLLLLLGVLAGVAWWHSQQKDEGDVLLAIDRSHVQRLTIERDLAAEKPEVLRFEKQDGTWHMLEPQTGEANETRIAHVMTLLGERVENSYSRADKDLAQFELEPGKVRVMFNEHVLVLGMANPVSQHRYILHDGNIKLVNETVFAALQDDVQSFLVTKNTPAETSSPVTEGIPEDAAKESSEKVNTLAD